MKVGSIFLGNRRNVKPLFVGSYGNDLTRGVYAMQIDVDKGEFLKKGHFKSQGNPISMVRKGRFVYLTYKNHSGRISDGGIAQYAAMEMQFGLAAKVNNEGKTYHHTFVNDEGRYAYAVDYFNGEVVTMPIKDLKIVRVSRTIKHEGSSIIERKQDSAHPIYINQTPDKKRIFVCDQGIDQVVVYSEGELGTLIKDEENTIICKPGSGPRKLIFTKDGQFAYVLNEFSSTIDLYQYNDCHFTYVESYDTYDKDSYGKPSFAGDIIRTKNNKYLITTNKGYDSIRIFEINQETGSLTLRDETDTDENPTALMIVDDRFVVVAAQKGGTLESFEIRENESKGLLFETHYTYMLPEPVCMVDGNIWEKDE